MCISFIYRNLNANASSYRFIIASNRDEAFYRPTIPAHFWKSYPDCLGGVDIEPTKEGGTWLALSKSKGRIGILLNLSSASTENKLDAGKLATKKGRGFLVTNFVISDESTSSYLDKLNKENRNTRPYNPYTLVALDLKDASVNYLSCSDDYCSRGCCNEDIMGFSNSQVDQPYQKVIAGKEIFKSIVSGAKTSDQDILTARLLEFLKSKEKHLPDEVLHSTHPEMYKDLSSIFINGVGKYDYATRTHTLIFIDGLNRATYIEVNRNEDGTWSQQRFDTVIDC